ncbi:MULTISPECIES: MFS transporter [Lacticaseibacillus]|uniref:MFS transporter n=1 Tax=Lacticaseibacillus TaxID=2759736 RepID=UPI00063DB785|nr:MULTISPECIES: MFS transporter [Lacticaseibacillus]KLI75028.1 hypothetical protein AAW28_10315 [Lacticaseibacillus casei]
MEKYSLGWHKRLLIVALLILNIVEQAASAVSGAIPQMAQTFSGHSEVQVELITTVVSMFVTIFVLVSGFLTRRFGQKKIAVIGLLIASISSIVPVFSENFAMIMGSRAILGVGIGLVNPLAISLIGEFFSGDTLANLMGWRSAVAGSGVAIMTFFAGQLLKISWHASYLVYLLFIVALILFIFFVPSPERYSVKAQQDTVTAATTAEAGSGSIWPIIGLATVLFVYFGCVMVFMVKIATFFVQAKIGTPTQASNILSLMQIFQLIGGALFGVVFKFLKKNTFKIGLLVSGISLIGAAMATTFVPVMIWSLLSGIFGGLTIPYVFTRVAELSTTKTAPLNNAICLVGSNMGSFLSPYIGSLLGGTAAVSIRNAGIVVLFLAAVVIILSLLLTKQQRRQVV